MDQSNRGALTFDLPPGVAPSPQQPQQPRGGEMSFEMFTPSAPTPPRKADYGRTIASGLQQAAINVPGMIGDLAQLPSVVPQIGTRAAAWLREKAGMPFSEGQRAAMDANAQRATSVLSALPEYNLLSLGSQALGGPKIKAPTSKEIGDAVNPYAERVLGVGPNYEPATQTEKVLKAGIAMAGPSALGPLRGAGSRAFSGLAGGAASEQAGEWAKDKGPAAELAARLAGAVAGGVAGQAAASSVRDVARATLAPDRAARQGMGEGLKNYDVESARLTQTMSRSPGVKEAADGMTQRMREFTQNLLGIDETAPQFRRMMEEFGAAERRRVYSLARSMPAARAIDDPVLNAVRNRSIFKDAEAAAMKNAADVPQWGIVPPAAGRPGNLAYYDQVKRELDSIISQAARVGDDTRKAAAETARIDMLRVLDARVPQYASARGIASDTFRSTTAPQSGGRFFDLSDDIKIDQFKQAFSTFSPEQKQGFALGFMGRLEQELKTKNPTLIANRFLKDKQFQEKIQFAFGKEWSQAIRGKVLSENIIQQADRIRAQLASASAAQGAAHPYKRQAAGFAGAAGAGAAFLERQAVLQFLSQFGISPTMAIAAGAGAAAGLGRAVVMTKVEQRVANRMIELMKRNDPSLYGEISRLIDRSPEVYNKILVPLVAIQQAQEKGGAPDQPPPPGERPQRASGGRVRISDRLMMAVERARRQVQAETKPILDAPDETVVRALKVAQQHI
jgi:hypothetical protein